MPASSTNLIQILNMTAIPVTGGRNLIVHVTGSNVNLMLYYQVTIPNAVQSAAAYAAVLATAVSSGKFTTYMQQEAAKSPDAAALLSATSATVSLGTEYPR